MKRTRWAAACLSAAVWMICFAPVIATSGCATNRANTRAGDGKADVVHAGDVQAAEEAQAPQDSRRVVVSKHGPRRR